MSLFAFPILGVGGLRVEDLTLEPGIRQVPNKVLPVTRGPGKPRIAAITKVPETAFKQMLRRQARDGRAVADDRGELRGQSSGTDVDHRHGRLADSLRDGLGFDAGNHAVSAPGPQPRGRRFSPALLSEVECPVAILPRVALDAVEQLPRVGVGGFDQQRHACAPASRRGWFPAGHRCILPKVAAKSQAKYGKSHGPLRVAPAISAVTQ